MKKKNKLSILLKPVLLLFTISLLLWNCEKEPIFEQNQFSVPSIENSKNTFLSPKILSKGTPDFISKIIWEESISVEFKKNIHILSTPIDINNNRIKSFIASIDNKGVIENQIITLLFDKDANSNYFSGMLLIHNNLGNFIKAYKYEKGEKVSLHVQKATQYLGKTTDCSLSYDDLMFILEYNDNGETILLGSCAEVNSTNEIDNEEGGSDEIDWQTPTDNLGGDGNPNGGGASWWVPTFQINNNLTNDCAKNIFTELESGLYKEDPIKPEVIIPNRDNLNFSEEILSLFNDSDKTHYTIQNSDLIGRNATTVHSTTTLSNFYLQNATRLSIARTMIHEQIHAYLNGVYFNYPDLVNKQLKDKLRKYASDKGYTDYNRFQHEFMAEYVNAMAYSLYEWDKRYGSGENNYNDPNPDELLGWDYYKAMAWGGLFTVDTNTGNISSETDSFKELVPNSTDRQEIADIVLNERNGNQDAKSEKCD